MLPHPGIEYSSGELLVFTDAEMESSSLELSTPVADKRICIYLRINSFAYD